MRHVFLGSLYALVAAIGFSFLASLVICCGADPEVRIVSDTTAPLLGIFLGAYFASRTTSWKTGAGVGLVYVAAGFGFWMYVMGRWNPLLWLEEGVAHLTLNHVSGWGLAILSGTIGGLAGRHRWLGGLAVMALSFFGCLLLLELSAGSAGPILAPSSLPGYDVERHETAPDGTIVYVLTFDFQKQNRFVVGLYDCDEDDAKPYDDSNTSYMGQSLESLSGKLQHQAADSHRQLYGVINGGFFGASGFAVAHHEEPIVQDGRVLYHVDLLRPRDQGCFFAVNSATSVLAGRPRFSMRPSIPWNELGDYETVLGGVRPLRVNGKSLPLKPGAGSTTLRCSRTSIGWSADGARLYILVVSDPDGELSSQLQRKAGWPQTGGWDVAEVQKFWAQRQVPFAVLFDGGESTQLAFRRPGGGYHDLVSGYQYSFTVGYLFHRPLRLTLPILPASEAHRGVLNYLYVDGPAGPKSEN